MVSIHAPAWGATPLALAKATAAQTKPADAPTKPDLAQTLDAALYAAMAAAIEEELDKDGEITQSDAEQIYKEMKGRARGSGKRFAATRRKQTAAPMEIIANPRVVAQGGVSA